MSIVRRLAQNTSQPQSGNLVDFGNPLSKGLRGFWLPTAESSPLPINRVTGNRSTIITGNVATRVDQPGRILSFATGNIDTGEYLGLSGSELTIAVRVRFPSSATLRLFGNHTDPNKGFLLYQNGLGIGIYLDGISISSSSSLSAGQWGQVAFSFIGGNKLIAVNGIVTSSAGSVSYSAPVSTATVKLGAYNWPGFPDYSGDAEYFAVWDRGLGEGELRTFQSNPYAVLKIAGKRLFFSGASFNSYTITPSGGVVFGGTAPISPIRSYPINPSGGIVFSGTSPLSGTKSYLISPSGGIVFGGTASMSSSNATTYIITPSGGVTFGGTSVFIKSHIQIPIGGIVFSGSAPISSNTVLSTVTTRLPLTGVGS